jgi:rhodanese-related sulfurtransferase
VTSSLDRLCAGDVIVLDVRPAAEYEAGHVLGARSIPITELRRQLRAIPRDADIVAYCRGPYCVHANDAVKQLRKHGYTARRLQDGYPEWQRDGLPVASGQ